MVAEKVSDMGCPVPSAQGAGGGQVLDRSCFFDGFCRKKRDATRMNEMDVRHRNRDRWDFLRLFSILKFLSIVWEAGDGGFSVFGISRSVSQVSVSC